MSTPSAPVISNAPLASPNTLEYWWYPPASDGGSNIQDYYLTLTSQYGTLNCNVGSPGTYYRVTGLSNATTYFTTIAASNANGLGTIASFREFQPGSPPPRGVSSLSAVAITVSTGAAVVSWTPPFGYPPVPDATIFWYVISGFTTANALTPVLKYTAGGLTQSNYFIPGLNSNNNYYFTVRAVNCPGWSVPLSTNTITWVTTVPFAPTQLNGITMWLDANDLTTFSLSGSNVTTWTDKVNSIPISRATNSVTYQSNIFTTSPAVYFNGGYLSSGTNALSMTKGIGNLTQFVVVRPTTIASGSFGTIAGLVYNTQNTKAVMNQSTTGVQSIVRRVFGETLASGQAYPFAVPSSFILNNYVNYSLSSNQLNINGTNNVFNTLTSSGLTDNTDTMFVMGNTATNERFNGYIGEYLLYTNYITPFDRQKIEGYLAWKWGLQSNLPIIHPFYTARPMSNSVFAPPMLSSLQLWLDASDRSSITTVSGVVSQWVDKTSNAYTLTQATAGSRPTYFNSTNQIIFSNDRFLNVPQASINNAATYTFFFVFTPVATSNWIMVKQYDGINTYNALSMTNFSGTGGGRTAGTSGFLYFHPLNGVATVSSSTALITNTQQLISMTYDATTLTMLRNGTQLSATAGAYALPNQTGATNFTMGIWNSSGVIQDTGVTNFQMNEFLFYNRGLSTQDRQTVEGYLAWKWGLQSNLATTHPYRYNNPGIVNFTQISPSTFGGMQLWLDASQLTGLSNGGSLSTWTDRSSNAYVGTAVASPTFVTNSINGLPIVRFNGSTQYINFGNVINVGTNGGLAIFAVAKYANANPGSIVAKSIYGGEVGRWALWRNESSQMNLTIANSSNNLTVYNAIYGDTNTAARLHTATWDRRNLYLYSNATLCNTVAGVDTGNLSNSRALYVGAYGNGAGSGPQSNTPNLMFNGDMAEVLVYTANVTPFIRQQIEGYLSWKWGLQASLPSSHPYFTAPPQQAYTTFVPTVYTGLQLWLDASDTTTLTGATSVSQWADKSGNNNNVSQAVTAQQPVRFTTTNGLTGLSYTASVGGTADTGGQWFRGTFGTTITSNILSVFMVGSMNSGAQSFGRAVSLSQLTSNDFVASGGGANIARNGGSNSLIMEANGAASSPNGAVTLATPFIAESIFDGANQTAFVNSTQTGTRAFTANFNIARSGIGFQAYQGVTTTGDRWDGTINEVLVYNSVLDTSERQTVEGYLAWKWRLQGVLPIAHPYKFMNPAINYTTSIINPNGLLVNFAAATYSGSGPWYNYGALGSSADATVETGITSKNVAGNGVVFNGSNNYTFSNISLGNAWSASVWVKQTGSNQPSACYLTQNVGSSVTNLSIFTNDSGASPPVGVNQVAGGFYTGTAWKIPTPYTLTSNVWVNLTYTWDGTTMTSYINGTSNALTTGGTATDSGQVYRIGRIWTGTSFIVGEIGQILIYNRPLSAADVAQNYAATSNIYIV